MTHRISDNERRARAALHALGSLSGPDAADLETHLAGGCQTCDADVASFAVTADQLSFAATPVSPPAELRDRLLTRARSARDASLPRGFEFVDAGTGAWTELSPGVHRKHLSGGPTEPAWSYFVRVDPGTTVPTHVHARTEHCYVVSGDLIVAGHRLEAGSFHIAPQGTSHGGLRSETGCVLLIVESHAP